MRAKRWRITRYVVRIIRWKIIVDKITTGKIQNDTNAKRQLNNNIVTTINNKRTRSPSSATVPWVIKSFKASTSLVIRVSKRPTGL